MRRTFRAHVAILAALALFGFVAAGGAAGVDDATRRTLRGVDPAKSAAYLGDDFRCDGGTTVIHKSKVNDEYCDCKDGTDEPGASRVAARATIATLPVPARRPVPRASRFPVRATSHQHLASPRLLTHLPRPPRLPSGTSACINGRFFCRNRGHQSEHVPSSRVNDGVCDCCDGSDERDGATTCANRCVAMGASRRETLRAKVNAARGGLAEKREIVARAPEDRKRLIAEKDRLTRETATAKSEVSRTAKSRDDAEREEKRARRAEERLAAKTKAKTEDVDAVEDVEGEAETPVADASGKSEAERRVEEAAANVAAAMKAEEVTAVGDEDEAPEGETDEERGRRIARQWIKDGGEDVGDAPADDSRILADVDDDAIDPNADADIDEEMDEEMDEETYAEDSDSDSDSDPRSSPPSGGFSKFLSGSWFGGGEKDATRRVRDRVVAATNAALSARAAADAASATLRDLESKLDDATVNLARYVGPRAEFAHMIGACYEAEVDKYAYSVCPFAEAKQDSTRLGTMTPLVANPNDPSEVPSTFSFVAGESCWNGPKRSMTVRLACGDATRLGGVTEPSRCEYAATLETPAACDERETEALEAELREMEAEAEAAEREEL